MATPAHFRRGRRKLQARARALPNAVRFILTKTHQLHTRLLMNPPKQSPDKIRSRLWTGLALTIACSAALLIWWTSRSAPADSRRESRSEQRDAPEKKASADARDRPERATSREADRQLKAEGKKTDVTLSTFPIKEYQHLPAPAGKPASLTAGEAFIHVPSASRRIAVEPLSLIHI